MRTFQDERFLRWLSKCNASSWCGTAGSASDQGAHVSIAAGSSMHEYLQRWLLQSTVVSQCTGSKSSAHRAVDRTAGAFILMLVDAGLLSVTHLLQAALESAAGAGCGIMRAGTEAQSSNGADGNKRKLWCASWMQCFAIKCFERQSAFA